MALETSLRRSVLITPMHYIVTIAPKLLYSNVEGILYPNLYLAMMALLGNVKLVY